MFIVTLLTLTVFLSYTLAGAAGDSSVLPSPNFELGSGSYRAYARDLILSNRFWIYLILGIGATLLTSTTIAIAFIMHVKLGAILATLVTIAFFVARALVVRRNPRRRALAQLLQGLAGASALCALALLLRS